MNIFDTYRTEMAARGYVEGQNVTYIQKGPPENLIEMLQFSAQLVEAEVDLIVVISSEVGVMAHGATEDIPIVFMAGDEPVELGLVESLNHPGGNVTGVMATGPEARRLELFLEMVPSMERIFVPHSANDPIVSGSLREIESAADAFGIEVHTLGIADESEVQDAIENIPDDVDGIFLPQDLLVAVELVAWSEAAIERKAAAVGSRCRSVRFGRPHCPHQSADGLWPCGGRPDQARRTALRPDFERGKSRRPAHRNGRVLSDGQP